MVVASTFVVVGTIVEFVTAVNTTTSVRLRSHNGGTAMTIIINSADKSTAILFLNNILSLLYEEGEVSLGEGNCVLFYSDGLVEADDPQGQMFGIPRLRALISEHGEERLLGNFLMEELYYFVEQGWEQEDDIILLTLRRSVSPS
jgi:hypothetical protein